MLPYSRCLDVQYVDSSFFKICLLGAVSYINFGGNNHELGLFDLEKFVLSVGCCFEPQVGGSHGKVVPGCVLR